MENNIIIDKSLKIQKYENKFQDCGGYNIIEHIKEP